MAVAVAAMAGSLGCATGRAAPVSAGLTAPDNWIEECDGAGACRASRAMVERGTGQRAAILSIVVQKDSPGLLVSVIAPIGIAVEPGVRLIFGGMTQDAGVQVCYPDGCRAVAALETDAAETLLKAAQIDIRYFAFGADAPVSVTVPLDGLATSVTRLRVRQ